jgi:hypothetical protein
MAAAQAAQVPLEACIFLESRSDGSWACHWWSEGVFAVAAFKDYLLLARQHAYQHAATHCLSVMSVVVACMSASCKPTFGIVA